MAFLIIIRPLVLAVVISVFFCNLGKAYDDHEDLPQTSTVVVGYDPYTGTGILGNVPQTSVGGAGDDPSKIVAKALLCFNEKQIYGSCEEAYRLSESGNLDVHHDHVDEYCNGPCLAETNLVLDCIENVMTNFVFYNKATIQDIRDTIKAGCGFGPKRGDFNVAEHLQTEENMAYKIHIQISFGLGLAITALWHALLL